MTEQNHYEAHLSAARMDLAHIADRDSDVAWSSEQHLLNGLVHAVLAVATRPDPEPVELEAVLSEATLPAAPVGSWGWAIVVVNGGANRLTDVIPMDEQYAREYAEQLRKDFPHCQYRAVQIVEHGPDQPRFPRVAGRCPSCRGESLFLADGGHVTCSRLDCDNPVEADDLLHSGTRGVRFEKCAIDGTSEVQGQVEQP